MSIRQVQITSLVGKDRTGCTLPPDAFDGGRALVV